MADSKDKGCNFLFLQEPPIAYGRAKSYGQAVQYTDNIVEVKAGSKIAVIVKRDASEVVFPSARLITPLATTYISS